MPQIPLAPSGQSNILAQVLARGGLGGPPRNALGLAGQALQTFAAIQGLKNQQAQAQQAQGQESNLLENVLRTATGRGAETVAQPAGPGADITGGSIDFNAQPGDRSRALQLLSGSQNPRFQEFALQEAFAQPSEPDTTSLITNLEAAGLERGSPEFRETALRAITKPAAQVNVDARQFPQGFVQARDEKGEPVTTTVETEAGPVQVPLAVPIPGSKQEREIKKAQEAEKTAQETRTKQAQNVIGAIGTARELAEGENIFSPATGFTGSLVQSVPGTRAFDLSSTLDTIKANVGFDRLQQMRDASPTGGALGQVSERENVLLQSTIANLEQSQSKGQFLENLKIVEDTFDEVVNRGLDPEKLQEIIQKNRSAARNRFQGMSPQDLLNVDVQSLSGEELDAFLEAMQ